MDYQSALLINHDGEILRPAVVDMMRQIGIRLHEADTRSQALELARQGAFEFAILERGSSASDHDAMVRDLKAVDPDLPIIVISTENHSESIETGSGDGVFDHVSIPLDDQTLLRSGRHALEQRRLLLEVRRLTRKLETDRDETDVHLPGNQSPVHPQPAREFVLVGKSEAIRQVRLQIKEVAQSDITVLIRGETGTGKGVAARLIHEMSGRAEDGMFIKISCPSVPEPLLESELFGHEAGAFTGAQKRKPGRLEMAAGGTVLLDEIGEVPLTGQAKLLQVFEHREFTRLGGEKTISVDARILGSTNAPLERMIDNGTFRTDLYFRLNQYTIRLTPLRERIEDIPLLVDYFLKKYSPIYGNEGLSVSPEMLSLMVRYPWPGNVRELESAMRRYTLTGKEDTIRSLGAERPPEQVDERKAESCQDTEKKVILVALTATRWNRRQAAKILDIGYNTLRRRISEYKLDVEVPEPPPGSLEAGQRYQPGLFR